jgi:predicted GIY-YIG superfamily endonuclease
MLAWIGEMTESTFCWSAVDILRFIADVLELQRRGASPTGCEYCGPVLPEIPLNPPMGGFHLYRLWTEDRRLLYVGVSTRLRARLRVHRKRWGDLIYDVTWEEYPDATAMLAAETKAINEEHPAMNKAKVGATI